jgi:membrane-associated phospholipid phosphatase
LWYTLDIRLYAINLQDTEKGYCTMHTTHHDDNAAEKRVWRIGLTAGIALFALGMLAAAWWDLPLDAALYSPTNGAAIGMECFGWYPIYLPTVLWLLLTALAPGRKPWLRVVCPVAAVGGAGYMAWNSAANLIRRGVSVAAAVTVTAAVWCVLAVGLALLLREVRRRGEGLRLRLCFAFGWATVYLAAQTVCINVLKLLWNRVRFDSMLAEGSFAPYTPWTHPFGNGGTSFPSGHTACACGIFVLILLCDVLPRWNKHRTALWAVCWAYVALMALSRLVMGRHFLSDTLMAAFVMTVLFFAITKSRYYRRAYQALGRRLHAAAQGH